MIGKHVVQVAVLLTALAAALVQAENVVVVLNVTGEGQSRNEAVGDALLQALAQVGGVQIVSTQRSQVCSAFASVTKDGEENNTNAFLEQAGKVMRTDVSGRISSYRIVSCEKTAAGQWEANLEVSVPDYRTPGHDPDNRRKLAVLPFRSAQAAYPVNGRAVPGRELADGIQRRLIDELTQSRRFAMVDRDFDAEYAAEKRLILAGDARIEELGKLGQALGVDYLLVGTVEEVVATSQTEVVAITGKQRSLAEGRVRVNYRVVVMATRQIKWSATVEVPLSAESADGQPVQIDPAALVEYAARAIAEGITDNIYPIRIVGTEGEQVLLNQGGTTVAVGEVLEVYSLGTMNIDPYTKEELGRTETLAARIQVMRVAAKLSYAVVVDGSLANISEQSVCRRLQAPLFSAEAAPPAPKPAVELLPAGGVRLPFDR